MQQAFSQATSLFKKGLSANLFKKGLIENPIRRDKPAQRFRRNASLLKKRLIED
jgi:hypothetical protein